MPLHPTQPSREMILVFGEWGTGKSLTWITLAQWLKKTNSPAKVYVLSTGFELERNLEGWDHSNVIGEEVGDFHELKKVSEGFKKAGKRDDWLVIDHASEPNEWVRDVVAEKEMGKSFSEWAVDSSMDEIGGAYGDRWGKINGLYRNWFNKEIGRFPGHVLATARARQFMRDKNSNIVGMAGKDKLKEEFGKWDFYPQGHGDLPYSFHSVILLRQANVTDWRMTVVRERTVPGSSIIRPALINHQLKDFVVDYLIGVAHWEVEPIYLKAFTTSE